MASAHPKSAAVELFQFGKSSIRLYQRATLGQLPKPQLVNTPSERIPEAK
jgi:hypothetical protein